MRLRALYCGWRDELSRAGRATPQVLNYLRPFAVSRNQVRLSGNARTRDMGRPRRRSCEDRPRRSNCPRTCASLWKGESMRKTQVAGASMGLAAIMLLSGCQCASRACSWVRRPFSRSHCEPAPQYISPSPQFGAPSQSISPVPMAPPSLQEETIPYSPPPYPPNTSGSGMR